MTDQGFKFYNGEKQVVKEVKLSVLKYVDWNNQCYVFSDTTAAEIKKINLLGGKIDLIFESQILASIEVMSIFSSETPRSYVVPCTETGQILIDDMKLCLYKFNNDDEKILINQKYYDFLKELNLLKM